jgi:hypothetical protein
MKKATGPGQVEPRCVPSTPPLRRLAWSLFNFDIDDATLKPEHQRWLDENVVPLLNLPGATAALRGMASRTGAADYNRKLSERRVDAVRQHLLGKGARLTQLTGIGVGEEEARAAGQADGREDDHFRAVVVEMALPVGNAPPRFDRDNLADRHDGFDDTEAFQPPWVLVRVEQLFRPVRLVNGQGLELRSTNEAVVKVEDPVIVGKPLRRAVPDPQFLRLRAVSVGDAEIHAVDTCGRVLARLRVAVREKLKVNAAFHYVKNRRYGTRTRRLGHEDPFLEVMNRIYLEQANIEFVKLPGALGARDLPLSDNLGTEINVISGNLDEWNVIVKNRHAEAQFNVFFVREVDEDAEGTQEPDPTDPTGVRTRDTDTCNALTTVGGDGDCILEDNSSPAVGVTLAHEAGHCLGVRHRKPIVATQNMLMFSSPNRGHLIPRIHVELMRQNVRRPGP